jgi:hypothetical protein
LSAPSLNSTIAPIGKLAAGTVTIGFCAPSAEPDSVRALRDGRIVEDVRR